MLLIVPDCNAGVVADTAVAAAEAEDANLTPAAV